MEKNIVLSPIPLEDLKIELISILTKKLAEQSNAKNRYRSVRWACENFDISKGTLYAWNRQSGGKLLHPLNGKTFVDIEALEKAIAKGGQQ